MKAVGYREPLTTADPEYLLDLELPTPSPGDRDLLVEIKAVSVNPVDTKVRKRETPAEGDVKVLGYDAVGIVRQIGSSVTLFKPGDRVWYSGNIARPGTNSQFHLVDERIVALAPHTLSHADAAALPLTALTAWELLFDRLAYPQESPNYRSPESLLILGAAGGVGSILIQLARKLTPLTVIATASRPESQQWVRDLGAHHVINHHLPLSEEIAQLGAPPVTHIASLTHTDQHFEEMAKLIAPQGKIGLIDDPDLIDIRILKRKCISIHWEFMFARPFFQTADLEKQHAILTLVAQLIDSGELKTTHGTHFGTINAENLRRAHAHIESHQAIGKVVLEGWS